MANPTGKGAGRPSGARSKITSAFLRDLARAWEAHGQNALEKLATEDPATLVRVCASILPKQVEGSEDGAPIGMSLKVTFIEPGSVSEEA